MSTSLVLSVGTLFEYNFHLCEVLLWTPLDVKRTRKPLLENRMVTIPLSIFLFGLGLCPSLHTRPWYKTSHVGLPLGCSSGVGRDRYGFHLSRVDVPWVEVTSGPTVTSSGHGSRVVRNETRLATCREYGSPSRPPWCTSAGGGPENGESLRGHTSLLSPELQLPHHGVRRLEVSK